MIIKKRIITQQRKETKSIVIIMHLDGVTRSLKNQRNKK